MANKFGLNQIKTALGHKYLHMSLAGIIGLLIVGVTVIGFGIYKLSWNNTATKIATKVIPYPAIRANGDIVTVKDYRSQLDALKNFQREYKKVNFENEDGKKVLNTLKTDVADQLIEDLIVKDFAAKNNIILTQQDVDGEYKRLVDANGGDENLKKVLVKYYNWTVDDFKVQLQAKMLRQKVAEKITGDDSLNKEAKNKAEQILKEVKENGDFEALAKKHSQDPSAANGGDLGWFGKGKMVKEFEDVAFSLKKDEISGVVKTVYGYQIIKITETKEGEVKGSHILIKGKSFQDWLNEQKKEAKIINYL